MGDQAHSGNRVPEGYNSSVCPETVRSLRRPPFRGVAIFMSGALAVKPAELRLAKRMARLGTETAFEVLVKARALEAKGRDIVHLEIGEPDFDTPANIIEAGV